MVAGSWRYRKRRRNKRHANRKRIGVMKAIYHLEKLSCRNNIKISIGNGGSSIKHQKQQTWHGSSAAAYGSASWPAAAHQRCRWHGGSGSSASAVSRFSRNKRNWRWRGSARSASAAPLAGFWRGAEKLALSSIAG